MNTDQAALDYANTKLKKYIANINAEIRSRPLVDAQERTCLIRYFTKESFEIFINNYIQIIKNDLISLGIYEERISIHYNEIDLNINIIPEKEYNPFKYGIKLDMDFKL